MEIEGVKIAGLDYFFRKVGHEGYGTVSWSWKGDKAEEKAFKEWARLSG